MQDPDMKHSGIKSNLEHRIFPVILPVPLKERNLKGRERVTTLSRLARQALKVSALKCRFRLGELTKDDHGVPLPFDGHYWSLTHKPKYVGAVISLQKTGIDIEEVRAISNPMFQRVAGDQEWRLGGSRSEMLFFRFWTAKEAVLKAEGVGMTGLSSCVIHRLWDRQHLEIAYQDKIYLIEHVYFNGHIAAVVKNKLHSQWTIPNINVKRSEEPCNELSLQMTKSSLPPKSESA
ncbi:MAG: 4'-phosphopantetheinyl transferase superfamily protein [Desulfobacterales bacterium]|nr:4'-phosphopantetheinyl transferase superfamily protein [Desulfobacterales bacterium]MDX2512496.1 4'-phosphopantetheinyl transferase superfamily protein [Desulfobacterales bacterium]